jgi:hypothetical protein
MNFDERQRVAVGWRSSFDLDFVQSVLLLHHYLNVGMFADNYRQTP